MLLINQIVSLLKRAFILTDKKLHFISTEIFTSTPETKLHIHRSVQNGLYRKLLSKIYTANLGDHPEIIISRNLWHIIAYFFPDGLITDRTAFECKPSQDGIIYLISQRTRDLILPGNIIIKPRKGFKALDSDRSFVCGLKICSQERSFLENLRLSRSFGRTLSLHEIEEKLELILRHNPENGLRQLRKNAFIISSELNMKKEYEKLDCFIGGLLGTKESFFLSPLANARQQRIPYDPQRVDLFQKLMGYFLTMPPLSRLSKNVDFPAWKNISFFEAYFSNFIEGTEFEIQEATDIVFHGKIPLGRLEDAHDVKGTYDLISSKQEMEKTPKNYDEFLELLKRRHAFMMASRPYVAPGEFKTKPNRSGLTYFVLPDLILGTLKIGFDIYKMIEIPFYRAIFMKFLISEVHPFNDGNGRLSRIMMNAELISHGEERIIIPNIYRGNYLSALSALSHHGTPEPLFRTLDFAQKYVASLPWEDFERTLKLLHETNALMDSAQAEIESIRLKLPTFFDLVIKN